MHFPHPRKGPGGDLRYSQGDRAVGQRVRGQDLRELQAAAHHLALGAGRPAGTPGPPVVLTARWQRRDPALSSRKQQGEQRQRQQQRRLHAAGRACEPSGEGHRPSGRRRGEPGPAVARSSRRPEDRSCSATTCSFVRGRARPPRRRGVRAAGSQLAARPAGAPPPPDRLLPTGPLHPHQPRALPKPRATRPRPGHAPRSWPELGYSCPGRKKVLD